MATKSFFEDMVIDTEEAARNLDRAFYEADHGINRIDTSDAKGPITDEDELRRILGW
jgi:hypothetical protein